MIQLKDELPHRKPLPDERILALLAPFGIHPSMEQILQIREYISLLLTWNETISLTAISDPEEIMSRHFGESMFMATIVPVENRRLADLGSGAGFPGLALKIIAPGLHVILIESNKKKCAFLHEVVRALELSGTEVIQSRFEQIRDAKNFADVITSRAVGDFQNILRWSRNSLSDHGSLALWVGASDSTEISMIDGWTWQTERIPESQRRMLMVGRPTKW